MRLGARLPSDRPPLISRSSSGPQELDELLQEAFVSRQLESVGVHDLGLLHDVAEELAQEVCCDGHFLAFLEVALLAAGLLAASVGLCSPSFFA